MSIRHEDVVIANGASLSGAVQIKSGRRLVGLYMPSSWTAADITFAVCKTEGGTFLPVFAEFYDLSGGDWTSVEVAVQATASQYHALADQLARAFDGAVWLKVRSGTPGSAVNQGAARTITLVFAV